MIRKAKRDDAKEPIAIAADLGYDDNCRRVVEEVVAAYGRIDILVNNAAEQYKSCSVEEIDEERLERVFRTNIFSYFLLTREQHHKHTSINAYKGNNKLIEYTSTKGAIVAFIRSLALQLAPKGIRVNGVAPGPIWTPLIPASFSEEECARFGSEYPWAGLASHVRLLPHMSSWPPCRLLLYFWSSSPPQWWGCGECLMGFAKGRILCVLGDLWMNKSWGFKGSSTLDI
ncbi:NADPH-dependent aldehyde reductase 1, chloroplastic [Vitis vinifera]|uniref:NADPH-dependent aldehyde reductase 1, chloroplastic n=1 Tax=Vitis vinifera TaxID=29760 RepID=A0A438EZW1_VITVI|nr:NADPH-dependent aldehyde reductase 1, chloroplastic [Vitis vinifera]